MHLRTPSLIVVMTAGVLACVAFIAPPAQAADAFDPVQLVSVAGTSRLLAVGDVTGDHIRDVVTASGMNIRVSVGSGAGSFSAGPTSLHPTSFPATTLALGDFNEDDMLDVVTGASPSSIFVGRGTGLGTFTPWVTFTAGGSPTVGVADMNRDGHQDIVVATSDGKIRNFFGDGAMGFTAGGTYTLSAATTVSQLAIGDIDGNGYPDVATANYYLKSVTWALNNGSGGLGTPGSIDLTTVDSSITNCQAVAIGDLNGDGFGEIVATGDGSPGGMFVINAMGGGAATMYAFSTAPGNVTLGDVTGDGVLDVVSAWAGAQAIVTWSGRGDRTFVTPAQELSTGAMTVPQAPVLADLNGDGWLDIVVGANYPAFAVLMNSPPRRAGAAVIPPTIRTLNYDPAGGTCWASSASGIDGTSIALPTTGSCTRDGFVLTGWLAPQGDGPPAHTSDPGQLVVLTGDNTLIAVWSPVAQPEPMPSAPTQAVAQTVTPTKRPSISRPCGKRVTGATRGRCHPRPARH